MNDTHAAELFGSASVRTLHRLPPGEALALAHAGGRLSVLAHAVWLTRTGDRRDHVLRAGDAIDLAPGEAGAVLEAFDRHGATVVWHPTAPMATAWTRGRERLASLRRWWTARRGPPRHANPAGLAG